jgi:hypothetical protein
MQYMNKIFLAIVGFILLMIVIVLLLISGGGDGNKPVVTGPTVKSLPNYANTGATVSLTTQGIVNGEDIHNSIRITVGSDERVLQIINGYNNQVVSSNVFPNNPAAYEVFLRSIGGQGFLTKQKTDKPVSDNENGYCPLGFRYVYELDQGQDELSRLWSSSCGQKVGTFGGNASSVQRLFQLQITGYNSLTSKVNLSSQ